MVFSDSNYLHLELNLLSLIFSYNRLYSFICNCFSCHLLVSFSFLYMLNTVVYFFALFCCCNPSLMFLQLCLRLSFSDPVLDCLFCVFFLSVQQSPIHPAVNNLMSSCCLFTLGFLFAFPSSFGSCPFSR